MLLASEIETYASDDLDALARITKSGGSIFVAFSGVSGEQMMSALWCREAGVPEPTPENLGAIREVFEAHLSQVGDDMRVFCDDFGDQTTTDLVRLAKAEGCDRLVVFRQKGDQTR